MHKFHVEVYSGIHDITNGDIHSVLRDLVSKFSSLKSDNKL